MQRIELLGYVCFWRGKRFEVFAETSYAAQKKVAAEHKIKRQHEITVVLAEKDGKPVTHVAVD